MGKTTKSLEFDIFENGTFLEKRASVQHKMEVRLGFWLQVFLKAEIIQNCLGAMRLEHIRRLTPISGAIPLRLSHASNVVHRTLAKILQNIRTLKTSQECSVAVAAMELQQETLWYLLGASCHVINLQS